MRLGYVPRTEILFENKLALRSDKKFPMRLTKREHLALAACMEQAAKQKWLTAEQRDAYLDKAERFRMLARYAKQTAVPTAKRKSATVILLKKKTQLRPVDPARATQAPLGKTYLCWRSRYDEDLPT